jgi:UDPglucose 6-dehydrogenase
VDLAVIGAGYVGLTTAVGFGRLGHRVTVIDVDEARVRNLAAGRMPIFEEGLEEGISELSRDGRLSFTTDRHLPTTIDVAFICVPTPINDAGTLDTNVVEAVVRDLFGTLRQDGVIVVRSTLPLDGAERLETIAGNESGPAIVVNPEFMREGHALADFSDPSRVAIGFVPPSTREHAERVAALYEPLLAPIVVADARSIVLVKLASNVFLGLKIAFADEIARLCDAVGADAGVIADGVGLDPRIGRAFLDAGPGFGGSCLPEQAASIATETARRAVAAPLLSSIAPSNERHQQEIVATIGRLFAGGLRGAQLALLGLAFKAGTDDVRHSPALALARGLRRAGATVVAYDPVANENARRSEPGLELAASVADAVRGADGVVVATEWPEFARLDWAALRPTMRGDIVYDTRRRLDADAVRRAGLRYVALGNGEGRLRPTDARERGGSLDRTHGGGTEEGIESRPVAR